MSVDRSTESDQRAHAPPVVSVVVPTKRRADLLAKCVSSILAQTTSDIEVIVVVDGPDPATIDFLSKLDDDRLSYIIHPESRGVSNARNTGIGVATGQWLAFCDDDDLWAPTKLEAQLSALGSNPSARWAIAGEVRFRDGHAMVSCAEPPSADAVAAALPYSNPVPGGCSGVIADRRLVVELGAFDPRLSMLADRDLWIRLNWTSSVAVADQPLVGYRDHESAMTRRLRNVERELDVIREKYDNELEGFGQHFPSDRFYVWSYRRTFSSGDRRGGFEFLARSPRFRSAVWRWYVNRARRRLGLTRGESGVLPPVARSATTAEFPWLLVDLDAQDDSSLRSETEYRRETDEQ